MTKREGEKGRGASWGTKRGYYVVKYFGGCRPPRSSLSQKRGGRDTELVTYGSWCPSVHSLYPQIEREKVVEKGRREGWSRKAAAPQDPFSRENVVAATLN